MDNRFVKVSSEGVMNVSEIWVDTETGVNYFFHVAGYAGGLKETQYSRLMATKPTLAMKLAVRGMLPKNSVGRWSLGRLKVYAGPEHKQQAQKPEYWTAE